MPNLAVRAREMSSVGLLARPDRLDAALHRHRRRWTFGKPYATRAEQQLDDAKAPTAADTPGCAAPRSRTRRRMQGQALPSCDWSRAAAVGPAGVAVGPRRRGQAGEKKNWVNMDLSTNTCPGRRCWTGTTQRAGGRRVGAGDRDRRIWSPLCNSDEVGATARWRC